MTTASPLPRHPLLLIAIFSTPYLLFPLISLILLLIYGGHHRVNLYHNPHCRHPNPPPPPYLHPPILLLQISDLHISHFKPSSKSTLLRFESETLPSFIPHASALIITGDLVDAVTPHPYPFGSRSKQRSDEWHFINSMFARINLSIPCFAAYGNHDSFGALSTFSPLHNFTCPSHQSSLHKIELHGLTLLAFDCTLPHPLHRPLNFFGDASAIARNLTSVLKAVQSPVLAFAHYPTAAMKDGARIHAANVASGSKVAAFLSGHLHTLKGFAPRGLQAVTSDGAFELELPDMVDAHMYRVIAFDQGILSFRNFKVGEKRAFIVTNPPRAGFCARGAGEVAASSSHIRMVHVGGGLEGTDVYVDGAYMGRTEILESCDEGSSKCVPVYGVVWNASVYDDGRLHQLVVRDVKGDTLGEHVFSLNGLLEGPWARWRALVSAMFVLSEFDLIAVWLCHTGLLLCMLLCVPGLGGMRLSSVALFVAAIVLKYGPAFIVGTELSDMDKGIGMVGLRYMRLPSGKFLSGVDVPFVMSVTVLYGSLLPACFVDALSSTTVVSNNAGSLIAHIFGFSYLLKCLGWCWEIFGAHGILAGFLSPSCMPLFVVLLLSVSNSLKRLISKRQK